MGMAARADIFYGFFSNDSLIPFDEEKDDLLYSPYAWEEEYTKRTGNSASLATCIIGLHGYHEEPGEFVAIRQSHITGDWDTGTRLDPHHFLESVEDLGRMNDQLREFCQIMSIAYQDPGWWLLCSDD